VAAELRPPILNFKLKAGSKAVDAGMKIPNVNDGFAGRAPDRGAYEVGQPFFAISDQSLDRLRQRRIDRDRRQ
jgi:hypothetical protein